MARLFSSSSSLFLWFSLLTTLLSEFVEGGDVWTELFSDTKSARYPLRRYAHAAAAYGDSLLITHGYLYMGYQNWLDDTWIFHPHTARWTEINCKGKMHKKITDPVSGKTQTIEVDKPVPNPRYSHSLTEIGGRYYLYGGDDGSVRTSPNNYIPNPHTDLWVLDVESKTWTEIESPADSVIPKGRGSHGAFAHQGCLYVFGGFPDRADMWMFCPGKGWMQLSQDTEDEKNHPGVRFSMSMILPDGSDTAYMFGGYRRGSSNMNDLWAYHIPTNKWKNLLPNGKIDGHVPHMRGAYAVAPYSEGRFVMWGGAECKPMCTCFQDTWIYDPKTNLWEEMKYSSGLPPPRYKHSLTTMPDGSILMFGGEGYRFSSDYHNDVWSFGTASFGAWVYLVEGGIVVVIGYFFFKFLLGRKKSSLELPSHHKGR